MDLMFETLFDWNYLPLYELFKVNGINHTNFLKQSPAKMRDILPEYIDKQEFLLKYKEAVFNSIQTSSCSLRTDVSMLNKSDSILKNVTNTLESRKEPVDQSVDSNSKCNDNHLPEKIVTDDSPKSYEVQEKIKNSLMAYTQTQKVKRLYKLLCSSFIGKVILYQYSETKYVLKKELGVIIIEDELNNNVKCEMKDPFDITCDRLEELTDEIIQFFTTETRRGQYYEAAQSIKSDTQRKLKRSGALVAALDYFKDFLFQVNLYQHSAKKSCSKKSTTDSTEVVVNLDTSILIEEKNFDEQSEELNYVEELLEKWQITYDLRNTITYVKKSVKEILDQYIVLKGKYGPKLILSDFQQRFSTYVPEPNDIFKDTIIDQRLLLHWKDVCCKIIKVASSQLEVKKKRSTKSEGKIKKSASNETENIQNLTEESSAVRRVNINYMNINDILEKNEIVKSEAHGEALAFLLLPSSISYVYKAKKVGGTWRPKQCDIPSSFIEHIEIPPSQEALEKFVQEKQDFFLSNKIYQVQPYVIFCGLLEALESSYAVFGTVIYKCASPVAAVDLCFQLFFSFNIPYPLACPHLWGFLQYYIYEIKQARNIVAIQKILDFVSKLDKCST